MEPQTPLQVAIFLISGVALLFAIAIGLSKLMDWLWYIKHMK